MTASSALRRRGGLPEALTIDPITKERKELNMKTPERKTVNLWIVALAVALALTVNPAIAADKPNILFIMGDDIGIMNVGAYHQG
jgi:hypothetical protein